MKVACGKCGYQFETEEKRACSYCGESDRLHEVKSTQEIIEE